MVIDQLCRGCRLPGPDRRGRGAGAPESALRGGAAGAVQSAPKVAEELRRVGAVLVEGGLEEGEDAAENGEPGPVVLRDGHGLERDGYERSSGALDEDQDGGCEAELEGQRSHRQSV